MGKLLSAFEIFRILNDFSSIPLMLIYV